MAVYFVDYYVMSIIFLISRSLFWQRLQVCWFHTTLCLFVWWIGSQSDSVNFTSSTGRFDHVFRGFSLIVSHGSVHMKYATGPPQSLLHDALTLAPQCVVHQGHRRKPSKVYCFMGLSQNSWKEAQVSSLKSQVVILQTALS